MNAKKEGLSKPSFFIFFMMHFCLDVSFFILNALTYFSIKAKKCACLIRNFQKYRCVGM